MRIIESDWTPSPLFSAITLCLFSLVAYGLVYACAPAVGDSETTNDEVAVTMSGERNTKTPVRFELRLASREVVEDWQRYEIATSDLMIFISPDVALTNSDVERAWHFEMGEEYAVGLQFTEEGASKLAKLTAQHIGEILAVMIDGRVLSAPIIAGRLSDRAEIRSSFTETEARSLAVALNRAR